LRWLLGRNVAATATVAAVAAGAGMVATTAAATHPAARSTTTNAMNAASQVTLPATALTTGASGTRDPGRDHMIAITHATGVTHVAIAAAAPGLTTAPTVIRLQVCKTITITGSRYPVNQSVVVLDI
jgi:hydroxymethylglutaryl-CoA reductase